MRYDKSDVEAGKGYVKRRTGGKAGGIAAGGAGGIVVLLLSLFLGSDITEVLGGSSGFSSESAQSEEFDLSECEANNSTQTECFMAFLMGDINSHWESKFAEFDLLYEPTFLNIFSGSVSTNGCGGATSAVGPFYCPAPADQEVYIDPSFFNQLSDSFGAPGDFAQAYVVAHEVGHHISNISGDSNRILSSQNQDPANKNFYQIQLELQADCYAGIWAKSASNRTTDDGSSLIEPGDLEEGLAAAAAVGDDTIQEKMTGQIQPHNWTHGSAAQRQAAFIAGFNGGEVESCSLEEMVAVTQQY